MIKIDLRFMKNSSYMKIFVYNTIGGPILKPLALSSYKASAIGEAHTRRCKVDKGNSTSDVNSSMNTS
jgi:hypothetical protein